MRPLWQLLPILLLAGVCGLGGCNRPHRAVPAVSQPSAHGSSLIEVSGSKQIVGSGTALESQIVVQVNDSAGNGVASALVTMRGPHGFSFDPLSGLTDSSGQFTTTVRAGPDSGRFQLVATSPGQTGKNLELNLDVVVLGYQQSVGSQLNQQYCSRCHDPESTPERVSNYDNLTTKPHSFADSQFMGGVKNDDLVAIITHGGPGIGKSAEMPAYGKTLKKNDIEALIAYIRAVSETQYTLSGAASAKE
jgi:hypothetical protein